MSRKRESRKEFDLPIGIIQHIQSFFEETREQAETCILNKSWFEAWSTRPNLNFSQFDFPNTYSDECFSSFCRKTMQRYKLSDLNLNSLSLSLGLFYGYGSLNYHNLADELVTDALKLGVNSISLGLHHEVLSDVVLAQVFASKSLTYLSLCRGNFTGNHFVVRGCPRLTSLYLHEPYLTSQTLQDIFSGCPLIENLQLSAYEALTTVDLSKMQKLVSVSVKIFGDCYGERKDDVDFKVHDNGLATTHGFRYLRSLHLTRVLLNNEFFTKFSSTFPCIEELSLISVRGFEDVQISSNSLRSLHLNTWHVLKKVKLNVPSISKFVFYVVNPMPILSFGTTTSRNWECTVDLSAEHELNEDSWFVDLKKLLTALSQSRISLYITISSEEECSVSTERIRYFPIPIVEELQVDGPSSAMNSNLLCGLFWSFRPSFISNPTNECLPRHEYAFTEFLYEHLIQKELLCLYNLEEFSLEQYRMEECSLEEEMYIRAWQSIPLIDDLENLRCNDKIRFRLKWGKDEFTGK